MNFFKSLFGRGRSGGSVQYTKVQDPASFNVPRTQIIFVMSKYQAMQAAQDMGYAQDELRYIHSASDLWSFNKEDWESGRDGKPLIAIRGGDRDIEVLARNKGLSWK